MNFFVATLLIGQCSGGHCPYPEQSYVAPLVQSHAAVTPSQSVTSYSKELSYSYDYGCCDYRSSCGGCYSVASSLGVGKIILDVPAESTVYINNHLTKSVGTRREYKSPNLNQSYCYDFDISVQHNGQTKQGRISLTAGQSKQMSFEFSPVAPPPPVPVKQKPQVKLQPIPVVNKLEEEVSEKTNTIKELNLKLLKTLDALEKERKRASDEYNENNRLRAIIEHKTDDKEIKKAPKLQPMPELDLQNKEKPFPNYEK